MLELRNEAKPKRGWGWLGALVLLIVTKFKTFLLLLAKLVGPIISMLVSVLSYAWLTGKVATAVGLVLMMLIHELGHVWAAKRKGLPVTLPLFIPFLGALIMMKKHPRDAETEAYIAFGGPLVGSLGALVVYAAGVWLNMPLLVAIAYIGFFLNLFNLIPIHPLDGGRISTAVTRWLWVVGLLGGLILLYFMFSLILLLIWGYFAWSLYKKFVLKRNAARPLLLPFRLDIPVAKIVETGGIIPGELHRPSLDFTTYSTRDEEQKLEVYWHSIGMRETVPLPQQLLVHRVFVERLEHVPHGAPIPEKIVAHCVLEGTPHINDRYFAVPAAVRWKFGFAYFTLALFLAAMMVIIHRDFPI